MGILSRFSDIMSSNINALLDKMEDPAKMVDQLLRNLNDDLGKVKAETAGVMAEQARCKRELDECTADIAKMQSYAEKAVLAGNDEDAKRFLAKKNSLATTQASLQKSYDMAASNATKMRQMHDKLCSQIEDLNSRRDSIKAKVAVARTQEKINKIGASVDSARGNMSAFDRIESSADRMLDQANAMAELNSGTGDGMDDLMDKYETSTAGLDDDLAALKARMGKDPGAGSSSDDDLAALKEKMGKSEQ